MTCDYEGNTYKSCIVTNILGGISCVHDGISPVLDDAVPALSLILILMGRF